MCRSVLSLSPVVLCLIVFVFQHVCLFEIQCVHAQHGLVTADPRLMGHAQIAWKNTTKEYLVLFGGYEQLPSYVLRDINFKPDRLKLDRLQFSNTVYLMDLGKSLSLSSLFFPMYSLSTLCFSHILT
jgi:hypothetical protein